MEISAGHKSEELCPNSDHMELEKSGDTIEVTSFIESFSRFHIPKLTNAWPEVEAALQEHGISYKLNLAELYMTVSTTPITKDPGIIHRAREVIVLLSKTTVPTYVTSRIRHRRGGRAPPHELAERHLTHFSNFKTMFSDLSPKEFRQNFLGLKKKGRLRRLRLPAAANKTLILLTNDLPTEFDWREKSAGMIS
ncbi:hypothetical protein ACLB2K_044095 [Fragaria x ananassa]